VIEKITIDDRELQQALLRFYKTKTPAQVLRAQARLMAVNLAFQTQPFGGSKAIGGQQESAKSQGEGTVASDIRKVIRTPADVYQQIEKQAIGAGRAFYAMIKKGDFDLAKNLLIRLRVTGLIQAQVGNMSGNFHKQALKPIPKRPRMAKRQEPLLITDEKTKLKAYVKEVQKKVGIAKGGWAACAMQLGGTKGRMETNVPGMQQQAVPAWVKRHAGKRAAGTVIDQADNFMVGKINMINHVPWVSNCLSDQQAQSAIDIQAEKMQRAMDYAFQADLKSAGF
jgi:hypothetical protein